MRSEGGDLLPRNPLKRWHRAGRSSPVRNARTMSETNNSLVLNCLREYQPIASVDIAQRLGIEPATVSRVLRRLAAAGFVRQGELGKRPHRCGRPPRFLHLNSAARYAIGIDVAGSECTGLVVDLDGRILHRRAKKAGSDAARAVLDLVGELLAQFPPRKRKTVAGVGIGAIDAHFDAGVMRTENGWLPIVQPVEARFGVEAFVEENSNAFAMAEKHLGFGRGASSFLCKWYRHGVGHALVIDGKLFRGAHHSFGELRDYLVPGREDNCPDDPFRAAQVRPQAVVEKARRMGEEAGPYLPRAIEERTVEGVIEVVADGIRQGDPATMAAVDRIAWAMSVGFSVIADFIDPELVVVGGPVTSWGEYMLDLLRKYVGELARTGGQGGGHAGRTAPLRIEFTRLGADVIALGGAALVLERLFRA